jgi:serine phosphatase RsbU (regulator of sigma subunit)
MDITVLEVNPRTRHIKFASAMRPVILFISDELYYIRGNRSGVGGEFTGDKVFDDQEYDLGEGDTIYLFSDGYPDQFGGPKGKKMKVDRVKQMLEKIHPLPMEEQYQYVKNYFFEWKGDSFQVDDVLFMGLGL